MIVGMGCKQVMKFHVGSLTLTSSVKRLYLVQFKRIGLIIRHLSL